MTAFPSRFANSMGRAVARGKQIGKGGEGAVFEVADEPSLALKLYWEKKAPERRDKIIAMVNAGWYRSNTFVAFPNDAIFAPNGAFAGFTMRRAGGHKPAHLLYSPASRKHEFSSIDFRFLVRAAANIARAVGSVHNTGCVIGDINHSGFLISDKATVAVIDSDSFQVSASSKSFLCHVGTPDYTPPELQGQRFDRVKRSKNHDNFGLAVLMFQLLFMGRHPFSGRYLSKGDMPLERAIGEFRFAYSGNKGTQMEPPPHVPLLADFPPYIGDAFESAFGRQQQHARPPAEEWVRLLGQLEAELVVCAAVKTHYHVRGKSCPWCKMERATPGFLAFTGAPQFSIPTSSSIDVRQLIAILNGIQNPAPLPNIENIVQQGTPPVAATGPVAKNVVRYRLICCSASLAGLGLSAVGSYGLLAGVVALGGSALALHLGPRSLNLVRTARIQAAQDWTKVTMAWTQLAQTANAFSSKRAEVSDVIDQIKHLSREEAAGIQKLEQKKRQAQLERHLERFRITTAKISKISSGRKAVLTSYGIETAADITQQNLARVPGFGPALIQNLMQWRASAEVRFVYNAREPLNPADVAMLKASVARKRLQYEQKARTKLGSLQTFASSMQGQRVNLERSGRETWQRLKEKEREEQAIDGNFGHIAKYASYACCGLALLIAVNGSGTVMKPDAPSVATIATKPIPDRTVVGSISDQGLEASLPRTKAPIPRARPTTPDRPLHEPTITMPTSRDHNIAFPPPIGAPATSLRKDPDPGPSANVPMGGPYVPPPVAPREQAALPALPPAIEIPDRGRIDDREPTRAPLLDFAQRADAQRIQQALIDLGLLEGAADGLWGPRSQAALSQYRTSRQLGTDATWDERTQQGLLTEATRMTAVQRSFVGTWTSERGQCSPAPLRINSTHAESEGGRCDFEAVKPISSSQWAVRAHCTVQGSTWVSNVSLTRTGDQLRWASERGKATYYLCQN